MAGNQNKAVIKYRREKCKQIQVTLFPKDRDIIEWLDGMTGKAEYIRTLIREDMKRKGEIDGN